MRKRYADVMRQVLLGIICFWGGYGYCAKIHSVQISNVWLLAFLLLAAFYAILNRNVVMKARGGSSATQ